MMRFKYDLAKATRLIAYILDRLGPLDKVKLAKLLYIAERDHFLRHGRPIVGDDAYAMRWGPVLSKTLDALNGQLAHGGRLFESVCVHNNTVSLARRPEEPLLESSERAVAEDVLQEYGDLPSWGLVRRTHRFPEYRATYQEGTSTPIPYETILRAHEQGDGRRHRLGRAVVSRDMRRALACPLEPWPANPGE